MSGSVSILIRKVDAHLWATARGVGIQRGSYSPQVVTSALKLYLAAHGVGEG